MSIKFDIDVNRAFVRLDAIAPNVHQLLLEELGPIAASIEADAKELAEAHIHTLGKDPGDYLDSIKGGVADKGSRVVGYVRSGSPLAHLLEFGAHIPAHDIAPNVADVLAFEGDVGTIYAREVHSPGANVPAYPALYPAFAAAQSEIASALRDVAARAGA